MSAPRLQQGEQVIFSAQQGAWSLYPVYMLTLGLYEVWRRATYFTVTNQRVIRSKGIVTKSQQSVPTDMVQDAGVTTQLGCRVHRTLRARPSDLIEADRAAMLPLPAVLPPLGWRHQMRLGRDHYVRLDASDYSVDPAVIGRLVEVTADLDWVTAALAGT